MDEDIEKLRTFLSYSIVGGIGVIVNTLFLFLLTNFANFHYMLSSMIATEIAVITNFIGNNWYTFKNIQVNKGLAEKFASYQTISIITIFGTATLLFFFTSMLGTKYLLFWNILAIVLMFIINYILNSTITWSDKPQIKFFLAFLVFLLPLLYALSSSPQAQSIEQIEPHFATLSFQAFHGPGGFNGVIPLNHGNGNHDNNDDDNGNNGNNENGNANENTNSNENTSGNTTTNSTSPVNATDPPQNDQNNSIQQNSTQNSTDTSNPSQNTPPQNTDTPQNTTDDQDSANNDDDTDDPDNTENSNDTSQNSDTNTTLPPQNNVSIEINTTESTNTTTTNTTTLPPQENQENTTNNPDSTNTTSTNTTQENLPQNTTQPQQNTTVQPNAAAINSFSSSVPWSETDGAYLMQEIQQGTFEVELNESAHVIWKVNGEVLFEQTGAHSQFSWTPGVYWSPRAPEYHLVSQNILRVEVGDQFREARINIIDVLNPFFSSLDNGGDVFGSNATRIHVMTNSNLVSFSSISVEITTLGGEKRSYTLTPQSIGNQVDWFADLLDLPPGNNALTKITASNSDGTYMFTPEQSRGHFVNFPRPPEEEKVEEEEEIPDEKLPQIVMALFGKDIVLVNETQTLQVDIQFFDVGTQKASVAIEDPAGKLHVIPLLHIGGDEYYGSWSAEISDLIIGTYILKELRVTQLDGEKREVPAQATFYAADTNSLVRPEMKLVNILLSENTVVNGSKVNVSIDASDFFGIKKAWANVTSTNGESFILAFKRVAGDAVYGTWKSTFAVKSPDTTYSIETVTLMNGEGNISTHAISDRKVYVKALPKPKPVKNRSPTTGMVTKSWEEIARDALKMPALPSMLAFGTLLMILFGVQMAARTGKTKDW